MKFRWRKRTRVPFTPWTINWHPWEVLRGFLDGPGGRKPRDGITSTTTRVAWWSWNSRGRRSFNPPGPGHWESERYQVDDLRGGQRPRVGCRRMVIVWGVIAVVLFGVFQFMIKPWWNEHVAPAWEQAFVTTSASVETDARVQRVVDGDTFVLENGDRVRVLGLSSCEASDPAGPAATADARILLDGQTVTLRSEPGVDRDQHGRALRYVGLPGGRDFATIMVGAIHSGVYEGGDASADYMRTLRSADPNGRDCG